jgi:hypothetical protein
VVRLTDKQNAERFVLANEQNPEIKYLMSKLFAFCFLPSAFPKLIVKTTFKETKTFFSAGTCSVILS